jgi:hypothetical protein
VPRKFYNVGQFTGGVLAASRRDGALLSKRLVPPPPYSGSAWLVTERNSRAELVKGIS